MLMRTGLDCFESLGSSSAIEFMSELREHLIEASSAAAHNIRYISSLHCHAADVMLVVKADNGDDGDQ